MRVLSSEGTNRLVCLCFPVNILTERETYRLTFRDSFVAQQFQSSKSMGSVHCQGKVTGTRISSACTSEPL